MEFEKFLKGIEMMPEAMEKLKKLSIPEEEYGEMKRLFYREKDQFYKAILKEREYRLRFLYYFCRFACDAHKDYVEKGIEDSVYWDTFSDLTIWCGNCYRDYGEYGLEEYDWLAHHVELQLFRLGRLQFEKTLSEWEILHGKTVISVHVPQGEKLEIEACRESVKRGYEFWGKEYTYLCDSWLLDPKLRKILKEDSNILEFQKMFDVVSIDKESRQAEERIFIKLEEDPRDYPEDTSLQREAKRYLINGGILGCALGVLK